MLLVSSRLAFLKNIYILFPELLMTFSTSLQQQKRKFLHMAQWNILQLGASA